VGPMRAAQGGSQMNWIKRVTKWPVPVEKLRKLGDWVAESSEVVWSFFFH
jgi:hypothetical protein